MTSATQSNPWAPRPSLGYASPQQERTWADAKPFYLPGSNVQPHPEANSVLGPALEKQRWAQLAKQTLAQREAAASVNSSLIDAFRFAPPSSLSTTPTQQSLPPSPDLNALASVSGRSSKVLTIASRSPSPLAVTAAATRATTVAATSARQEKVEEYERPASPEECQRLAIAGAHDAARAKEKAGWHKGECKRV